MPVFPFYSIQTGSQFLFNYQIKYIYIKKTSIHSEFRYNSTQILVTTVVARVRNILLIQNLLFKKANGHFKNRLDVFALLRHVTLCSYVVCRTEPTASCI